MLTIGSNIVVSKNIVSYYYFKFESVAYDIKNDRLKVGN